jgi:hypothetical protein
MLQTRPTTLTNKYVNVFQNLCGMLAISFHIICFRLSAGSSLGGYKYNLIFMSIFKIQIRVAVIT